MSRCPDLFVVDYVCRGLSEPELLENVSKILRDGSAMIGRLAAGSGPRPRFCTKKLALPSKRFPQPRSTLPDGIRFMTLEQSLLELFR